MAGKLTVLVVDDHPVLLDGLSFLINKQPDLKLCGSALNAASALKLVRSEKPDVVVADISLGDDDGIDFIKDVKKYSPRSKIIVFSIHDEKVYAARALRAGASGYVMKSETHHFLLEGIRAVTQKKVFLRDSVRDEVLAQLASGTELGGARVAVSQLSAREMLVFKGIGSGKTSRQIAQELQISVKTVQSYRERIKAKLNLPNALSLVKEAVLWQGEQRA